MEKRKVQIRYLTNKKSFLSSKYLSGTCVACMLGYCSHPELVPYLLGHSFWRQAGKYQPTVKIMEANLSIIAGYNPCIPMELEPKKHGLKNCQHVLLFLPNMLKKLNY